MYQLALNVNEPQQVLQVSSTGKLTSKQVIKMYNEIIVVCQTKKLAKILLDATDLELAFHGLKVVENMHKLEPLLEGYKLARIIKTIDVNSGLIESYSQQKQINIRNFESEKEALTWLNS